MTTFILFLGIKLKFPKSKQQLIKSSSSSLQVYPFMYQQAMIRTQRTRSLLSQKMTIKCSRNLSLFYSFQS